MMAKDQPIHVSRCIVCRKPVWLFEPMTTWWHHQSMLVITLYDTPAAQAKWFQLSHKDICIYFTTDGVVITAAMFSYKSNQLPVQSLESMHCLSLANMAVWIHRHMMKSWILFIHQTVSLSYQTFSFIIHHQSFLSTTQAIHLSVFRSVSKTISLSSRKALCFDQAITRLIFIPARVA